MGEEEGGDEAKAQQKLQIQNHLEKKLQGLHNLHDMEADWQSY
jgi:hypothetical protein